MQLNYHSGVEIVNGKIGSCICTPGSPATCEDNGEICNALSGNHPFSMAMWVYSTGSIEATPPFTGFGQAIGGWYGGNYKGAKFAGGGNGGFYATVGFGPSVNWDTGNASGAFNQWQHLALVGSNLMAKFYFNGSLVDSIIKAQPINNGYNQTFKLFRNPWDWVFTSVSGTKIDDVRIYDYVISDEEVKKIYNNGNGTERDDLLMKSIIIKEVQ